MNISKTFGRFLIGAWLPVLLIAWWWFGSMDSTDPYWPPLKAIWEQTVNLWVFDNVPIHMAPSLRNLFVGLFLGIALGVLIGAHLALSPLATRFVLPVVDFLRSIPSIAFIPIFIMFFGLEGTMRVAVITFVVTFPVLLTTIQAVRSTDPTLLDTVKVYGFSQFQTLWRVRLPAGAPQLFAGFQLALLVAFVVTIGSEILGAGFGLGAFTKIASDSFLVLDAWTGVIVMGLIGYVLFQVFEWVERYVLRWYYGAKKLEK